MPAHEDMKRQCIEYDSVERASEVISRRRADQEGALAERMRLLCVDDDILGAEIRGQILESEGYSVVLKHCPLDALTCDFSIFDLAVVDFEMPKMNGRELLLRMRAMGASFPIILLSGLSPFLSFDDRVLFSRCLDKGEPVHRLLDTISNFLDPSIPDCGS